MKPFFYRAICIILILSLLLPMIPAVSAGGAGFFLVVFTEAGAIIEPERIPVRAGQNLRQALLASDHQFEGLEQGYIQAVDGVADSFYLAYDGGGYDLDVPAENITGLMLTTRETPWSQEGHDLLLCLGAYSENTSGVRNYPPAQTTYGNAMDALFDGFGQVQAREALEAAISEFDAMMAGETAHVQLNLSCLGEAVEAADIRFTGPYGDIHSAAGSSIDVIPGHYEFEVRNGPFSVTRGSVDVPAEGCTLTLELPGGSWFSEVRLLTPSDRENGYERDILSPNSARFLIPDTAGSSSVFLNAVRGDVPDTATTRVWTDYVGLNGTDYSAASRSWNTTSTVLTSLLAHGMEGRQFRLEARYPHPDGYSMIEYYEIEILRVPTLKGLQLFSDGVLLPLDFDSDTVQYSVNAASDSLTVCAETFGDDGYRMQIGQQDTVSGERITIPASSFTVTVTHENGLSRQYTVNVSRKNPVTVRIHAGADTRLEVFNSAMSPIPAQADGTYRLIPGESYSYITTKNTWYHAAASFTASPNLSLTAAEPQCQDWISALSAAQKSTAGSPETCPYPLSPAFSPEIHSYDVAVSDVNTTFAAFLSLSDTAAKVTAEYTRLSTGAKENRTLSAGRPTGTMLPGLIEATGYSNSVILKAGKSVGSVTYYQEYALTVRRQLHLYDCTLCAEDTALTLTPPFDRDITEYRADVPQGADTLEAKLCGIAFGSDTDYTASLQIGSYVAECELTAEGTLLSLPLDTDAAEEILTVTVAHADSEALGAQYTFLIHKLPPVTARFHTVPKNAVVGLVDQANDKRVWAGADGAFVLLQGHTYTATATCPGYLPQTMEFPADTDQVFAVALTPAPANDTLPKDMESEWPDFRGNPANNAVVDTPLPIEDSGAVLYWASELGEGYSSSAVGCPILADGCIYTYAGTTIYKVDPVDGSVLAQGEMAGSSSFAINAPTYAEGMIFVGLANGRVQAFNAETLESLWLYSDPLKGQPNCCITYKSGCIYTGFWNGETANANFVCITVTDEDPTQSLEAKEAVWTHTCKGGYYWSGACIREGALLIGTDDGESGYLTGYASLLSVEPRTGKLLDRVQMPHPGDIRCAISYDDATDSYYFTSKGGYFYSVRLEEDGTFAADSLRYMKLSNGGNNPSAPPMSTCTPVIYNGRAYIGVSGTAQFGAYSGHNITVLDLAQWKIAYSVPTQGYCQTSGLLTTAYEEETGKVYVYFFDNYTPGKLRLLEDAPGQTRPSLITRETYRAGNKDVTADTAYVLFTPNGAQAQYAICSPICDSFGTMFFKNDSGFLMALGPVIEELRITEMPCTTYDEGAYFDPAGMRVEAVYANGMRRDVTDYLSYSPDPLTADDTEFGIRFEHTLYQNRDGEVGRDYYAPMAALPLVILTEADHLAAEAVEQLIDAIVFPVTLEQADAIGNARTAFELLTDAQKSLVGNFDTLLEAENALEELLHVHEFGDWAYLGDGIHARFCLCGQQETEPCTPETEAAIPATCTAPGRTEQISCIICGGIIVPGDVIPVFPCPSVQFTDVKATSWYHDAVDYMVLAGIMAGSGSGKFQPSKNLTRAELVQVFYNMAGAQWESRETAFTDVSPNAWYAIPVAWAANNGLVSGTSPTTFSPKSSATREMVVTILFRYVGAEPGDPAAISGFADGSRVSSWAVPAVAWAVENDILRGSDGSLNPRKDITRAELAQLMTNYLRSASAGS